MASIAANSLRHRTVIVAVLFSLLSPLLVAQHIEERTIDGTTITYSYTPIVEDDRTALERYLDTSLDERSVRFNIIGGPGYSANTGWRLAAIGNLYYRQAGQEHTYPGTLSLTATASLTGYYDVTIHGANTFRKGKHRLSYGVGLCSEPTYLWGLDYATAAHNDAGEYTSRDYGAWLNYRYAITRSLFLSLGTKYQNIAALHPDAHTMQMTEGLPHHSYALGFNLGVGIDTRQRVGYSTRGIYAAVEVTAQPQLLNNTSSNLYTLNITFDYYQPLWRGATLALDLYGEFHSRSTPWLLRAELGGESRMRGYYRGRYNGNNLVAAQVELRQHVWEGLGIGLWGGAGETFSHDDRFAWRKVLPTYGAGLRWSLNALMAIRLEMAFGRDSRYFILGFNEAF